MSGYSRLPEFRKGQGLVEMALVLPVILVVVMGVIDFARVYNVQHTLHRVAKEGVNFGTQMKDGERLPTETEVRAQIARSVLPPLDGAHLIIDSVNVQDRDADGQSSVSVQVSYDIPLLTPLVSSMFTGGQVRVTATARLPFTQFDGAVPPSAPPPAPSPITVLPDGSIKLNAPGSARIKILGKQLQYGAGGPPIPVTVKMSEDGISFFDIFGGSQVNGGEEMIYNGLLSGDKLAFSGRARLTSSGGGVIFDKTYQSNAKVAFSDSPSNFHQYSLLDGDPAIFYQKPGFSGQTPLKSFMAPFVDTTSAEVQLGPKDAIVLFEYNSAFSSTASDFQDLVVLVQYFDPATEPPPSVP